MTADTDREKVRIFWDYSKSLLLALMVVLFSAYLGAAGPLRDITLAWGLVPGAILSVILILVLLYGVGLVLRAFQKLALETDKLLRKVEKGESLPDLQEILDIKVPSVLGSLRLLYRLLRRKEKIFPYIT